MMMLPTRISFAGFIINTSKKQYLKNAPFICLEPWHGFADSHNSTGILDQKAGLFALEPYEIRDFAWFVQI